MPPRCHKYDERVRDDCVAHWRAGEVVAFATETVYGLGAETLNADAVAKIFALKNRPADNPLIAHVHDVSVVRTVVSQWTDSAAALVKEFWPGALTLVLPRADAVPPISTGGRETIAVRCPDHPVALELLAAHGGAISAPSANRSGHISPTCAAHVMDEFRDADDALLIVDGGPCSIGIESTVLDCTTDTPRLLRPGSVTRAMIEDVVGPIESTQLTQQGNSPGTRSSHYAPQLPTRLVDVQNRAQDNRVVTIAPLGLIESNDHVIVLPNDAAGYAANLYDALRKAEQSGAERIEIIRPGSDDDPAWHAVLDRLRRASTPPD